MKRALLLIPAAIMAVFALVPVADAQDYTWTDNGDGTCTITRYIGPGGDVIIPDTLGGLTVTDIGYCAFLDRTSLTDITLPDSVITIGFKAFYNCTSLTSITIPDSVIAIGGATFINCTSLTSVTIGNSLTIIAGEAFRGCTSLTDITIPDSVTIIGNSAFWGCTSLTDITLPDSVTIIDDGAFFRCTSLTGFYCKGDAPSLIGSWVFYDVSGSAIVYYRPDTTGWGSTYGGLPTAVWPLADADFSTTVDIDDFAILTGQWLETGCGEANGWCGGADFDRSGGVDAADLLLLADDWLWP